MPCQSRDELRRKQDTRGSTSASQISRQHVHAWVMMASGPNGCCPLGHGLRTHEFGFWVVEFPLGYESPKNNFNPTFNAWALSSTPGFHISQPSSPMTTCPTLATICFFITCTTTSKAQHVLDSTHSLKEELRHIVDRLNTWICFFNV